MSRWKEKITTGWGLLRFMRLGLSALMLYEAWESVSLLPAFIGAILLWQALWNTGCCGTSGCDTGHMRKRSSSSEAGTEIENFEEVK